MKERSIAAMDNRRILRITHYSINIILRLAAQALPVLVYKRGKTVLQYPGDRHALIPDNRHTVL